MFPVSAAHNAIYRRFVYLQASCDVSLAHPLRGQCTNFNDLSFSKFCAGISLSAFGAHIRSIVGVRAKKQMIGIDTVPYIAGVTNAKAVRDRAIVNLPGNAMGKRHASGLTSGNLPITARIDASLPQPAFMEGAGRDISPEAVSYRGRAASMSNGITSGLAFDISPFRVCTLGNRCKLPATALAIAVGDFVV